MQVNKDTPIAMLTVGQLKEFLQGENIVPTKEVIEPKKYAPCSRVQCSSLIEIR